MQPSTLKQKTQQLTCPQLPLAVYLEVAAHLRQVAGVDTSLIMRLTQGDREQQFDYYQSQVAAIQINYSEIAPEGQQQVAEILDYYAQRYQPWETK